MAILRTVVEPKREAQRAAFSESSEAQTFESFVVGPSNRLAASAAKVVAEAPGRIHNPLFVYGGPGLGKTHLLRAIERAYLDAGLRVCYMTSEAFKSGLESAIRRREIQRFRESHRRLDALLIDDVQFVAGENDIQEGFSHAFDALRNSGRQIVLSADRPPRAMAALEERLRSRFEWGVTVEIRRPEYETRSAILQAKAEQLEVEIPGSILFYIAERVESNVRELEGALDRVLALHRFEGLSFDRGIVDQALEDLRPLRPEIRAQDVIEAISRFYGVSAEDLCGKGRTRRMVEPRQVAMYLLRTELGLSLNKIGAELGGRDHTTILYGCKRVRARAQQDKLFRRELMLLRGRLHGRL